MKGMILILLVISSLDGICQDKTQTDQPYYILIDSNKEENLFVFKKTKEEDRILFEVVRYDKRDLNFLNKTKLKKDAIVLVTAQPNPYTFEFWSKGSVPKKINSIDGLITHNVTAFSKLLLNRNNLPKSIVFIEKMSSKDYVLWGLKPMTSL